MNDITDNRIEKNLLEISRTMLVKLPNDRTFTLTEFVNLQQELVNSKAGKLQGMNVQIEAAVEDMITLVKSYPLNPAIEGVFFFFFFFTRSFVVACWCDDLCSFFFFFIKNFFFHTKIS